MAQFKRVCRIHVEEPCGDECSPECSASWHLREAFSLVPRNDGRKGRMAVCFDCYLDETPAADNRERLRVLADRINAAYYRERYDQD